MSSRHVKRENASLPVDVRRSKTPLLKLSITLGLWAPWDLAFNYNKRVNRHYLTFLEVDSISEFQKQVEHDRLG